VCGVDTGQHSVRRDISKLVDDQELVSGDLPLQTKQPLLIASLQQFMNKGRGCIEPDR
jgi:hypothetical protein